MENVFNSKMKMTLRKSERVLKPHYIYWQDGRLRWKITGITLMDLFLQHGQTEI